MATFICQHIVEFFAKFVVRSYVLISARIIEQFHVSFFQEKVALCVKMQLLENFFGGTFLSNFIQESKQNLMLGVLPNNIACFLHKTHYDALFLPCHMALARMWRKLGGGQCFVANLRQNEAEK